MSKRSFIRNVFFTSNITFIHLFFISIISSIVIQFGKWIIYWELIIYMCANFLVLHCSTNWSITSQQESLLCICESLSCRVQLFNSICKHHIRIITIVDNFNFFKLIRFFLPFWGISAFISPGKYQGKNVILPSLLELVIRNICTLWTL